MGHFFSLLNDVTLIVILSTVHINNLIKQKEMSHAGLSKTEEINGSRREQQVIKNAFVSTGLWLTVEQFKHGVMKILQPITTHRVTVFSYSQNS